MMRRSFALVPGLALVAALSAASAPARAATTCSGTTDEPIQACGSMTFHSSSASYAVVRFPAGTEFDNNAISVTGSGPFAGILVTPDPPYLTAPNCGRTSSGDLIKLCPNPADGIYIRGLLPSVFGTPRQFVSMTDGDNTTFCSKCRLAGGLYRVYVLAEGTPVTVSVTFPGLGGSVDVSPTHGVKLNAGVPDPALEPSGSSAYGAGLTGTLGTPSMQFGVVGEWVAASADNAVGVCFYDGDPGDPRFAYQPGCFGGPTSNADSIDSVGNEIAPLPGQGLENVSISYPYFAGTMGTGGWAVAAGVASKDAVDVLELAFDHS